MSLDIWLTLRNSIVKLFRTTSGKQWKKFYAYSVFSWTATAIAVLLDIDELIVAEDGDDDDNRHRDLGGCNVGSVIGKRYSNSSSYHSS